MGGSLVFVRSPSAEVQWAEEQLHGPEPGEAATDGLVPGVVGIALEEEGEAEAGAGLEPEEAEAVPEPVAEEGEPEAAAGLEAVDPEEVPEVEWRARFELLTLTRPRPTGDLFPRKMVC